MNKHLLTALLVVCTAPCAILAQTPAQLPAQLPAEAPAALAEEQRSEIESLARDIERAVLDADTASYIALLEQSDAVFLTEQTNWANDLAKNPVEAFEIKLDDVDFNPTLREATARMTLVWNLPGKRTRQVAFPARFASANGDWKYAGENWAKAEDNGALALFEEGLDEVGQRVVDILPEVREKVHDKFGLPQTGDLAERTQHVKLYRSMAHLQASIFLGYADVHGSLGGWNKPGESIKVLARRRTNQDYLRKLLSHEYGHVIAFSWGEHASQMPWWLLEGIAESASEPFANTRALSNAAMRRYAAVENIAPWELIADFEDSPSGLQGHVYRQGHHMVMFVEDTYGVDKLTAWSKAMAGGKTVDEASREQLGIPWQALDQNWRQSVAKLLEEDN